MGKKRVPVVIGEESSLHGFLPFIVCAKSVAFPELETPLA